MSQSGQEITKATYEDPEVVENYIQRNALNPKNIEVLNNFSMLVKGKRVLDLGCGPGHETYLWAELGYQATGLDYSSEMIKRAKDFKSIVNQPKFLVGDMKQLTDNFRENEFDAIWASASLLHIPPEDLPGVLAGMTKIIKNGGYIYVGLKQGKGMAMVKDSHLAKPVEREFTLWEKESFVDAVKPYGWELKDYSQRVGRVFRGEPTRWHNFFF